MQLQTRDQVRALFGGAEMGIKNSRKSQLAAASYLYQLAEQVRNGAVQDFDVSWASQGNVEASVTPQR